MRKTLIERKCFAAFEFHGAPRTAHRQFTGRTSHNCLMRRLNPSPIDDRAKPVAPKPFDLLIFFDCNEASKTRAAAAIAAIRPQRA
jgi:hypothetical protein